MSRATSVKGLRARLLTEMSPETQQACIEAIREIESANGRALSDGPIVEDGRDVLVFFRYKKIVGAVSIYRIPVVDFSIDPKDPRDFVAIAEFMHAFTEGVLHSARVSEYIAAIPLGVGQAYIDGVAKRFDSEHFSADQYRVFRKSV